MRMRYSWVMGGLVVLSILGFLPTQAGALPIPFYADTTQALPGLDYGGIMDYSGGTLTIFLTNLSDIGDPRLTGFAFLNPDPEIIDGLNTFSADLSDGVGGWNSLTGWSGEYDLGDIHSPDDYGSFDVAALTGGTLGGGDPNDGLAIGDPLARFTFVFDIVAPDTLTTASFVDVLAPYFFVARFQSVGGYVEDGEWTDDDLSDVVPASTTSGGGNGVIPEPMTVTLLGLGLAGFAATRLRRR